MSRVVFVVDDHRASAESLAEALADDGYQVRVFDNGASALAAARLDPPEVVITDLRMDGMDGLELLRELRGVDAGLPVILITAYASIERAVEATRSGAFAFVTKPIRGPELLIQLRNAVSNRELARAARGTDDGGIIGRAPSLLRALGRADRAAVTEATVLIRGESGTGKELLARRLHNRSDRASGPFVPVNCGAIPDSLLEAELFGNRRGAFTGAVRDRVGLIESAEGGTLFLDEVGELSAGAQTRLLRFLQEGTIRRVGDTRDQQVDARVVAATHRDLAANGFREDLFYRLNVIPIELPPLRGRGGDVLLLFAHALRRACERMGRTVPRLDDEVVEALSAHRWPGNVRELFNVAEQIAVLSPGDVVELVDLPAVVADTRRDSAPAHLPDGDFDLTHWLEQLEERALRRALIRHDGVKARAAASLGLERNAFRYKLKKYGIS